MNVDLIALLHDVPWLGPYLPGILAAIGIVAVAAPQLPVPTRATGWYVVVWRIIHWVAQNYRNAKPAAQPPCKDAGQPTSARKGPPPGVAAALALLMAAGALAACTDAQKAQVREIATIACQVDGLIQPVAVQIAPMAGATGASLAHADALLLHPAVVAACATLHGTPEAVIADAPAPAAPAVTTPVGTPAAGASAVGK